MSKKHDKRPAWSRQLLWSVKKKSARITREGITGVVSRERERPTWRAVGLCMRISAEEQLARVSKYTLQPPPRAHAFFMLQLGDKLGRKDEGGNKASISKPRRVLDWVRLLFFARCGFSRYGRSMKRKKVRVKGYNSWSRNFWAAGCVNF